MVDMVAKAKAVIIGLLASAATTAATLDLTLPPGDYMLVPVQPYTVVTIQGTPIDPPVLDTDGDGINDDIDQCEDTPLGDEVDATGCTVVPPPVDTDGDGVTDDVDQCPAEPGMLPDGCPIVPPDGGTPVRLSGIVTCDNIGSVWVNGSQVGTIAIWNTPASFTADLLPGENVVAVRCEDQGGVAGMLATLTWGDSGSAPSGVDWRVSTTDQSGWNTSGFDDSAWTAATPHGGYGVAPWFTSVTGFPPWSVAKWIWTADNDADNVAYFRYKITVGGDPVDPPVDPPAVSIDDMEPGTWLEIPNSNLRDVAASVVEWPWLNQGERISGIMNDWCSGAFDTRRDRLLIGPCGGHNGYFGNEVYAFDLNDLRWHRLTDPQPVTGECPDPALYPCAIHTYDGLEYIPALDALVQVGGWGAPNTYALDIETNTWQVFSPSNQGRTGDVSAWDEENGLLWVKFSPYAASGKLYSWNPATDTWVEHGPLDTQFSYYTTATIDPVRRLMVATGQHEGKVFTWPLDPSMTGVYATALATTGATAMTNSRNPGFEYHPPSGLLVAWDGGQSVYTLDLDTSIWTEHPATGADPGPANVNGTYGRFRYVPSKGVFVVVNSVDSNVFVYKPDFGLGQPVTSFKLDSPLSGAQPYTIGLGFKKGDVIAPAVDGAQVVVKRRWNDGSAKHAVVSGVASMPASLSVYPGGGSSGPPMTAADITTANPQAHVQLGNLGSVDLADLLHEPFRTWISGPEMVEAHYRGAVETGLVVWFHVRLYKGGLVWVRASVENGTLDTPNATRSYAATVTIGGAEVFADAEFTHHAHTRWTAEGWIGGDPQVTPKHDTGYLIAAGLVPNYWKRNPTDATLDGLYQAYAPNQSGGWTQSMGMAGFQNQIGLLPKWDALYVTSADARAYRAVLANAKALNSFGIIWTDSLTGLPVTPSARANWTACGQNQGGGCYASAGDLKWEISHHGSGGYLAYLLTGDYYHLETMAHQTASVYLINGVNNGLGTFRQMKGQARGAAWSLRTVGQLAGIGPDGDPLVDDYRELIANNISHWRQVQAQPDMNGIGYFYDYGANGALAYGDGHSSPWMQHFWIQAGGYIADLEPLADMTEYNAWLNDFYRAVVGILGAAGQDAYCYTKAGAYVIDFSDGESLDPTTWHDTWGDVFVGTYGVQNTVCGDTLEGTSGGNPAAAAFGYWGNLLPAIAYAVDDSAEGAAESWIRLMSAANWQAVASSGFDDTPNWGVVPRS